LPILQKTIAVLWPSFLVAGVATVVFFTVFDPQDLGPFGNEPVMSRLGAYTIGFFLFWTLMALSSVLTIYFLSPPNSNVPRDSEPR